jgi:hypothetical protein
MTRDRYIDTIKAHPLSCAVPCRAVLRHVQGGVSGQVKQRMLLTQQHPEMELRPMLLFPEVRLVPGAACTCVCWLRGPPPPPPRPGRGGGLSACVSVVAAC